MDLPDNEAFVNTYLNFIWYNSLSDYFKGSVNENCSSIITENSYQNSSEQNLYCSINNWLYVGKDFWTMTPVDYNYRNYVWYVNSIGRADFSRYDGMMSDQGYFDIYPVFYLSHNINYAVVVLVSCLII